MKVVIDSRTIRPEDLIIHQRMKTDEIEIVIETPASDYEPRAQGTLRPVHGLHLDNTKVGLIKLVRELSGCGLKEAKDWVEEYVVFR